MFRSTLEEHKLEHQQQLSIIDEYKTITSNLSKRIETSAPSVAANGTVLSPVFIEAVTGCSGSCRQTLDSKAPGWDQIEVPNGDKAAANGEDGGQLAALTQRVSF